MGRTVSAKLLCISGYTQFFTKKIKALKTTQSGVKGLIGATGCETPPGIKCYVLKFVHKKLCLWENTKTIKIKIIF